MFIEGFRGDGTHHQHGVFTDADSGAYDAFGSDPDAGFDVDRIEDEIEIPFFIIVISSQQISAL